jgi:hypothetical protein
MFMGMVEKKKESRGRLFYENFTKVANLNNLLHTHMWGWSGIIWKAYLRFQ